jgi:enoyl-CoA hydratase/carnithine racemase
MVDDAGQLVRIDQPWARVTRLTLNRPRQYNALSLDMLNALDAALERVAADDGTSVVVLAAEGKAFCAGHDLREIQAHADSAFHATVFARCGEVMVRIAELPQPVIAAVNGIATAAGCQLVASCDLAVAVRSAQFATSGIRLGFFCATPGVAVTRAVPPKRAMEMLLAGDFIDAETAAAWSLINDVVDDGALEARVEALASHIAARPRAALVRGKQAIRAQAGLDLRSAYRIASEAMVSNLSDAPTQEGINAFLEKRAPNW